MATLKISELSVGDWVGVRCGTKINAFKVEEIRFNNIIHKYVALLNNKAYGLPTTELHPIPITSEILEKNGFESTTKPNVFTLTHGQLQLYVSKELDGWTMSFVNFMERLCILQVIRKSCIHELQHALRLAGVDKEINL